MKIDVNIKVDEEQFLNPEGTELASGWVEIENCIKFPVKVRKYTDKEGKDKMFVTYPQRKNGERYEGIVYPHDKEVREEIEETVLKTLENELVKEYSLPEIESVRVSPVRQSKTSGVALRGMASIKIAGITINGITIKEGQKGLFVQMPQYKSGGEYRDTVYGTNAKIQTLIKEEVLKAYENTLKEEKKPEKQAEQEHEQQEPGQQEQQQSDIDRFIMAFQKKDKQEMLDIFAKAEKEISDASFTENWNAVRIQGAVIAEEKRMIDFSFHNSWNPLQQIPPDDYLTQSIQARIYENGDIKGLMILEERKSKSLKNAEKNYEEVLSMWKDLTQQEKIKFPREQQKQKPEPEPSQRAVAVPGFRR